MNTVLESSTDFMTDSEERSQSRTSIFNEKKWEWTFLKKKCRNLELEQFYESYMQRLRVSHLNLYIYFEALCMIVHSLILFSNVVSSEHKLFYVDITVYLSTAVLIWIIFSINFRRKLVKKRPWIMYVSSWVAVTVLIVSDAGIPIYRAVTTHDIIRPAYYCFTLYSVYIFMPLPSDFHALMLGIAVTISYLLTFSLVTYRQRSDGTHQLDLNSVISEAIFFMCVNILGLYFRMTREIAIRTTFLDRRQCVEENLLLRYARDQEKNLLLSIIPAQIANKIEQDVKIRIEHMKLKNKRKKGTADARKLFIEPHDDVTILYADVVNYTYLTTQLDVKTLVETIHDLFVKFDTASEEFNVLRIKFLGDCYYCVSGVPIPNEYHARCCVYLGLRMIKDIRDVRNKRQLDIDMRIGVHSGNILSGVIGASKWQFDIWSKDVDIANRLESTGVAGRVHVSEQTLKLLDGEFVYEEGTTTAREDVVLRKYHIRTFLIKPPSSKFSFLEPQSSPSSKIQKKIEKQQSKLDLSTNFMQNILKYNQIRSQAKLEMSRELDKMPIGRIQFTKLLFGQSKRLTQDEMEEQSFRSNITTLFLFFKDWRWEIMFMKEPDVMLKYSILCGFLVFISIIGMQAINAEQSMLYWYLIIVEVIVIFAMIGITWFKKFWVTYLSESEDARPTNEISLFLFNLSDSIQSNIVLRIAIYLVMVVLHCSCAMIQMIDCKRSRIENEEIEIQLFKDGVHSNLCFNPWDITESMMLALAMSFLFTRIPFILKLCIGFIIFFIYTMIVLFELDFVYEKSLSTNVGLYPEYSHILVIILTFLVFHLMDRKTEFISKVDYNWKRQLLKKQDDAKFTNETITILINNILPSHVADIYMSKTMRNELYYEEYDNVAVMFATIRNYDTEQVGMRVLNEIICDFDEVLSSYKGPLKVEKIKVAGWTYMAACGLDPSRSEHVPASFRNSSLMPNGRRSQYSPGASGTGIADDAQQTAGTSSQSEYVTDSSAAGPQSTFYSYEGHQNYAAPNPNLSATSIIPQSDVVFVMAQFALDLMRAMHAFNMENLQCEDKGKDHGMLRIGISHGPVMAGVVGSYRPHYDIWGNPVNMASRMDSTGIPGSIQITEETAQIMKGYNISCTYRGLTYVKGRGKINTYFLDIDEDLNYIRKKPSMSNEDLTLQ